MRTLHSKYDIDGDWSVKDSEVEKFDVTYLTGVSAIPKTSQI